MYNKNKRAPSIDPCGTPEVIGSHSDSDPEKDTRCLRPESMVGRKPFNRFGSSRLLMAAH